MRSASSASDGQRTGQGGSRRTSPAEAQRRSRTHNNPGSARGACWRSRCTAPTRTTSRWSASSASASSARRASRRRTCTRRGRRSARRGRRWRRRARGEEGLLRRRRRAASAAEHAGQANRPARRRRRRKRNRKRRREGTRRVDRARTPSIAEAPSIDRVGRGGGRGGGGGGGGRGGRAAGGGARAKKGEPVPKPPRAYVGEIRAGRGRSGRVTKPMGPPSGEGRRRRRRGRKATFGTGEADSTVDSAGGAPGVGTRTAEPRTAGCASSTSQAERRSYARCD